jgi:FMN reductase
MNLVAISGSPSPRSRSAWLLQFARTRLEATCARSDLVVVRDLPADALVRGDAESEPICVARAKISGADTVLVATPIYKAAYSGLLKLFFDLLAPDAFRGKTVLPIATGGSLAHLLALDYALKPVLSALGASAVLDGMFAVDAQLVAHESGGYLPDDSLVERLDRVLRPVTAACRDPAHAESALRL